MSALPTPPLPPPYLTLPELCLVVLIGAPQAGKSTFARRHFAPHEVFEHTQLEAAEQRLAQGQLTVIEAPYVSPAQRQPLLELARRHDVQAVAIVLDLPKHVLQQRQQQACHEALHEAYSELRRTFCGLHKEGFGQVWRLSSAAEIEQARLERVPLPCNLGHLSGPFDFVGDVHGCLPELLLLLERLGYQRPASAGAASMELAYTYSHPEGRTLVFVGDLADRGPDSVGVLRLVQQMQQAGTALCVCGNHDDKLRRALEGKAVSMQHGLEGTLQQLACAEASTQAHPQAPTHSQGLSAQLLHFLAALPSHLLLDGGQVVVAHAGLPERYQGRQSSRERRFTLYGDIDGSTDAQGLPIRKDWAATYEGQRLVVYGHTPVARPRWLGHTVNIDTGCVFGGHLSALRYPERQTLSVPALRPYALPSRPFLTD